MSKITGFYTDDEKRVRPITARKTKWRRKTPVRIFGYHAEYKDKGHSRLVTCHFRVGTRYVKATNEFERGKDLESEFLSRPIWVVDPRSFAVALKSFRADEASNFRISMDFGPERYPSHKELKEVARNLAIASRFKLERPNIYYDSADRDVEIFFNEPVTFEDMDKVAKLREKGINYYGRRIVRLKLLTDFAWELPSYMK